MYWSVEETVHEPTDICTQQRVSIDTQMTFVAMFKLRVALPDHCECNDQDEIQATLLKRNH